MDFRALKVIVKAGILFLLLLVAIGAFGQQIAGREIVTRDDGIRIWVQGDRWGYQIDFIEVVDATRLRVKVKGEIRDMPLWGIQSPRIDQKLGLEAKNWVERCIEDMYVELQPQFHEIGESQMGDSLYVIYLFDLVESGYAWVKPEIAAALPSEGIMTPERLLVESQNSARSYMRGVWRETDPTPPWERYK